MCLLMTSRTSPTTLPRGEMGICKQTGAWLQKGWATDCWYASVPRTRGPLTCHSSYHRLCVFKTGVCCIQVERQVSTCPCVSRIRQKFFKCMSSNKQSQNDANGMKLFLTGQCCAGNQPQGPHLCGGNIGQASTQDDTRGSLLGWLTCICQGKPSALE